MVNKDKTKTVIFRKSDILQRNLKFYKKKKKKKKNVEVDIVKAFLYLGMFLVAVLMSLAEQVQRRYLSLIITYIILMISNQNTISPILNYGTEVWGVLFVRQIR